MQLEHADNMTDRLAAALSTGLDSEAFRDASIYFRDHARDKFSHRSTKYFALIASCPLDGTLGALSGVFSAFHYIWNQLYAIIFSLDVCECTWSDVMASDDFDNLNPNCLRAAVGTFARANPDQFHATDGSGYRFLREQIEAIDSRNPQVCRLFVCS